MFSFFNFTLNGVSSSPPPLLLAAYGNVVELRINTKGVGGKLPNFGFVVFDDSDPVQRILGAKVVWGMYRRFLIDFYSLWWWLGHVQV